MRVKIFLPTGSVGPAGMLLRDLAAQIIGNSKTFLRAKPRDPLPPVAILALARRGPIARDEGVDIAGNHVAIRPRRVAPRSGPTLAKRASHPSRARVPPGSEDDEQKLLDSCTPDIENGQATVCI